MIDKKASIRYPYRSTTLLKDKFQRIAPVAGGIFEPHPAIPARLAGE
jgi:hypothetical protein